MSLTGCRITFPASDTENNETGQDLVFRASSAAVSHRTEPAAVSGGNSIIGLATEIFDVTNANVQADGKRQQARLDTGGGVHVTQISLRNWEGSTDRWGETDSGNWDATGAAPTTQLQVLDNAFRRIKVDSNASITLECEEYSSSGRFDPLGVAPLSTNIGFDPDTQASTFEADLEFADVLDLRRVADSLLREEQ